MFETDTSYFTISALDSFITYKLLYCKAVLASFDKQQAVDSELIIIVYITLITQCTLYRKSINKK